MKLIAHRGNNNHKYDENTYDAIINSLNKNYISGVEIDVRITKDKEVILYHDKLLHGTAVNRLEYNDIKNKNNSITKLDYLLNNIKTDKIILIELKSEINDYHELVDRVVNIIRKSNLNIYLCSFNYSLLKYLNKKYDKYPIGIIVGNMINHKYIGSFDYTSIKYSNYDGNKDEKFVWTINSKKEISKFIDTSLYVITDKAYIFKDYFL